MSDLRSYLEKHKADFRRTKASDPEEARGGTLTLTVVILSVSETHILIGHLGRKFSIAQEEIIQISDAPESTPNLFGYGRTALIVVKSTATLVHEQSISVADLGFGQPFATARPTTMPPFISELYSPNEVAWRQVNQVPPTNFTPFVTASTSYSQTSTLTNCRYANDDAGFDDSQGDDIGVLDD